MFSCMSDGSVGLANGTTLSRISDEADRLQQKCRSLRALLLETENKRAEEKEAYENQISTLRHELETGIAELQTQKILELTEMRDYRTTEVRELKDNLAAARTELSMQGALIIALTRKVTHLERHAEELETNHSKAIGDIQREHDSEVRNIALARSNYSSTDQQTLLLRRALAAERELARLRSSTLHTTACGAEDGDNAGKGLQEELQRERERNRELQDQVRQLNQDLAAAQQLRVTVDTSTGAAAEVQRNRDGTALMASPSSRLERALDEERHAHRETKEQVAGLQAQLREVVATRAAVELAVRGVLAENERLAAEVDALTARLEACGAQSSAVSAAAPGAPSWK